MHFSEEPAGIPSKDDRRTEHETPRNYFIKQKQEDLGEMVYAFPLAMQTLSYNRLSSWTDHRGIENSNESWAGKESCLVLWHILLA